jgi:hypothetical protein
MLFPLSKSGSFMVEVPGPAEPHVAALETALVDWLAEKRARSITHAGQAIAFKAGAFRLVNGLNILCPTGSGEIRFSAQSAGIEITYRLRFTEMFIVVTALLLITLGPFALSGQYWSAMESLTTFIIAWSLLFGASYLMAIFRIPSALKHLARQATGGTVV